MSVQRLSDSQILTDLDSQIVAEAVWHSFSNFGMSNVVMDPYQGRVSGSTGLSFSSYGKTFTAFLQTQSDGLLISLRGDEQVPGTIDFGRGKKQLHELGNIIVIHLRRAEKNPQIYSRAVDITKPNSPVPPISSPFGPPQNPAEPPQSVAPGMPVYGMSTIPKRGTGVLIYGLLGLLCCKLVAPLALFYGMRALDEYKTQDPGDRAMVVIGMVLGGVGCGLLLIQALTQVSSKF